MHAAPEPDLSIKLGVAAALKGVGPLRSGQRLLADALRHIVISVRGNSLIGKGCR